MLKHVISGLLGLAILITAFQSCKVVRKNAGQSSTTKSTRLVDESMMSPSYIAMRDEFLRVNKEHLEWRDKNIVGRAGGLLDNFLSSSPNSLNDLMEKYLGEKGAGQEFSLETAAGALGIAQVSQIPADTKWFLANLLGIRAFRGFSWLVRDNFGNWKFGRETYMTGLLNAYSAQLAFAPENSPSEMLFDYFAKQPYVTAYPFQTFTKLQTYLIQNVKKDLQQAETLLRDIADNHPANTIVLDFKTMFGGDSFEDNLDRFRALERAEFNSILAANKAMQFYVNLTAAYNLDDIGYTVDMVRKLFFDNSDEAITWERYVAAMNLPDPAANREVGKTYLDINDNAEAGLDGKALMAEAFSDLQEVVALWRVSWDLLQNRDMQDFEDSLVLYAARILPWSEVIAPGTRTAEALVGTQPVTLADVVNGNDQIRVNISQFFLDPVSNLTAYEPTRYESGSGSGRDTSGEPVEWDHATYKKIFPDLPSGTDVVKYRRILARAWSISGVRVVDDNGDLPAPTSNQNYQELINQNASYKAALDQFKGVTDQDSLKGFIRTQLGFDEAGPLQSFVNEDYSNTAADIDGQFHAAVEANLMAKETIETKWLGAQVLAFYSQRGVLEKFRIIADFESEQANVFATLYNTGLKQAATVLKYYQPDSPSSNALYEYIRGEDPQNAAFADTHAAQDFMLNKVLPKLEIALRVMKDVENRIGDGQIIIDNQTIFDTTAAFRYDYDRFRVIKRRDVQAAIAAMNMTIHNIYIASSYNLVKLNPLANELRHRVLNPSGESAVIAGAFSTYILRGGLTPKERNTKYIQKPDYSSLFTLKDGGGELISKAFPHLWEAVCYTNYVWNDIKDRQISDKDDYQVLNTENILPWQRINNKVLSNFNRLVGLRATGGACEQDESAGVTALLNPFDNQVASFNLVALYNNPPADLKDLLPTDYKGGLTGYKRGFPREWDTAQWTPYFPDLAGGDVKKHCRTLSQTWGAVGWVCAPFIM